MARDVSEKKAAARILYMDGFSQQAIAKVLKMQESQLSHWVNDGDWPTKRNQSRLFREKSEESVQDLITYQLDILCKIKEISAAEAENAETVKQLEELLIKRGDIDALQKLFTTIKDEKEIDWKGKVKLLQRFTASVSEEDNELAKKLMLYVTQFLNDERQQDFKDK